MTTIVNLGAHAAPSGDNAVLNALNVSTSSVIVVIVSETSNTQGTIADSSSNIYTQITLPNFSAGSSSGYAWFAIVNHALVTGSITYTLGNGSAQAVIRALYFTGGWGIDNPVTNSTTGSGTNPTVSSGTPLLNDLLIGAVISSSQVGITQAPGWTTPSGEAIGNQYRSLYGYQVSSSLKTYNPTLNVSLSWGAAVFGFRPGVSSSASFATVIF